MLNINNTDNCAGRCIYNTGGKFKKKINKTGSYRLITIPDRWLLSVGDLLRAQHNNEGRQGVQCSVKNPPGNNVSDLPEGGQHGKNSPRESIKYQTANNEFPKANGAAAAC